MIRKLRDNRRGLTLFQLLIIIAVIAFLIGLLLPAVQKVREAAARTQSVNNLKQMSLGVANMAAVFRGQCPSGYGTFPGQKGEAASFFYHLLPFIEQDNVYKAKDFKANIKIYVAPTDQTNPQNTNASSYCLNGRIFGGEVNGGQATYPGTWNQKGSSNTINFFERFAAANGAWGDKTTFLYASKDPGAPIASPIFGILPDDPGYEPNTGHGYNSTWLTVALSDGAVRSVGPEIRAPYAGTTIWGWALSVTGPKGANTFGNAPPPDAW